MNDSPPRRRRPPEPRQRPLASSDEAHRALAHQRAEHHTDDVDIDDDGIGALINNTGLDGDAASG